MAIIYNKLISKLTEKGITSYTIKKSGVIGQATWKNIHDGKQINTSTLNTLCKLLDCQPGDILEYVPDPEESEDPDNPE